MNQTNLKEEIGGIIFDADIYKNKVTCGQLNDIVDEITKEIEKTTNELKPKSFSLNEIRNEYYKEGFKDAIDQIKELLK